MFTQFREIIGPLAERPMAIFGRPGLVLHGATGVGKRQRLVTRFQSDGGAGEKRADGIRLRRLCSGSDQGFSSVGIGGTLRAGSAAIEASCPHSRAGRPRTRGFAPPQRPHGETRTPNGDLECPCGSGVPRPGRLLSPAEEIGSEIFTTTSTATSRGRRTAFPATLVQERLGRSANRGRPIHPLSDPSRSSHSRASEGDARCMK